VQHTHRQRLVLFFIALGLTAATSASGQSLSGASAPAEFPPASYAGLQYVDSRGCAYVRAGVDGAVTWVPRVTRQRQVICGLQPTFATRQAQQVPVVADEVADQEVVVIVPDAAPAQRPATRVAAAPTAAKPVPVAAPVVAPQPKARQVLSFPNSACPGAPASSQAYINSGENLPVRCGPQAQKPQNAASVGRVPQADPIVPDGFAFVRPTPTLDVSAGLVPVWKDGRLNPNRGVPATRSVTVSAKNTPPGTGVAVPKPEVVVATPAPRPVAKALPKPAPKVIAKAPAPTAAVVGRYVQVGTFGVPANAQRTAQRFQAMGLPVRIGQITRKGRPLQIVMTGPFGNSGDVRAALGQARAAGFADAFVR